MAITVGTVNTGIATQNFGGGSYGDTYTLDADCTLLVLVFAHEVSGTPVASATWNGTAMTKFVEHSLSGGCVGVFALGNPAIGTYDLKISTGLSAAANSPWFAVVNIKGAKSIVGGTRTGTPGEIVVQGSAGLIVDIAIGDTACGPLDPSGVGLGARANFWASQTIGASDVTGACRFTHSGSNPTTNYAGDLIWYAGAEIIEGSDFIPSITII